MSQPLNLKEAVSLALSHDPALAHSTAVISLAEANVDIAKSGKGVSLMGLASLGISQTDFTTDTISQTPNVIGLKAEKTVFSSGALEAALTGANAQLSAAQLSHLSERENTALQTVTAFVNSWVAGQVVIVSQARVETLRLRLSESRARFSQGILTKTDISLSQSRLASAEADLEYHRSQLSSATARLKYLTGVSDPTPTGLNTSQIAQIPMMDSQFAHVLEANTELATAQANTTVAEAKLREVKGKFGPKVTVSARAFTSQDTYFFFEDRISDVGAFISVEAPLYTSGLRAASKRRALAELNRSQAQLRQKQLELQETTATTLSNIKARERALIASRSAEAAAGIAAQGARREHEEGLRTMVESLDVEDESRSAQIRRITAEAELFLSRAQLSALLSDLESQILR